MNYDWITETEHKRDYVEFIESRRKRDGSQVLNPHLHHIKPRHYYVDAGEVINNTPDNLIILSPSEHAYSHYLLCKATDNYKDHCAVWRTLRGLKPESLTDLEFLNEYEYPSMPDWVKNKLRGRKRTIAQKQNIANGSIGNSNALGHKCSDVVKAKLSELKKDKPSWNKGKSTGPKHKFRSFYNIELRILEEDITVTEMSKKYNLGVSSVSMLANNRKKSFRNWVCLDNLQPSQRQEIVASLEGSETRN
jgi:hypothetical protein